MAAVDLARVLRPVQAEGGAAEDDEAAEMKMKQREEKHIVASITLPAEPPVAAATSEPHGVQVSQVGGLAIR